MPATQAMAPLPAVTLAPGMELRFETLDPASGAAVLGVVVAQVSVVGVATAASLEELRAGAFLLVPGASP